jgi:ribokinase
MALLPPPRIVVVGSCNMDISAFVERAPERGETVMGTGSRTGPGGKGANQAIAAARLGASVGFVGAVGADAHGAALRAAFAAAGVDTSQLRTVDGATGTAHIVVESSGDNRIVVVPGANGTVRSLTAADRRMVEDADLLLLQLELPLDAVAESARVARAAGTTVLLTPAPVQPLPDELVRSVDVLVPNEQEALQVAGAEDLEIAIARLVERVRDVVVTRGERGGLHASRDGARTAFASPQVEAVDSTGAGDTFVGALALALGQGRAWPAALERAAAAAAISVARAGASESMPSAEELERQLGAVTRP